jgi:SAM-dependent methyltransferase
MDHADHVALLRDGVPGPGGTWADFGSGTGAFALALAELIGPSGLIYSVDSDRPALRRQERTMRARFPGIAVRFVVGDFRQPLDLPLLDGAVMANALHFQPDRGAVVQLIRSYLRPGGLFLLVEYNTDRGNPWVPHPLSYDTWETVARENGLSDTRLLAKRPSRFLGEIYSAASVSPALMTN